MEGGNVILQDICTFAAVAERDENDRIKGNFNSFGLLQRSAVYRNAVFHGLIEPLKQLFGKS